MYAIVRKENKILKRKSRKRITFKFKDRLFYAVFNIKGTFFFSFVPFTEANILISLDQEAQPELHSETRDPEALGSMRLLNLKRPTHAFILQNITLRAMALTLIIKTTLIFTKNKNYFDNLIN